jgi:polyphosphate kinase 2
VTVSDVDLATLPDCDQLMERVKGLGDKRRNRIVQAAWKQHLAEEARAPFEAEMRKLERFVAAEGRRLIVLFEGRDAAGKGGAVYGVGRTLSAANHRVVALRKPTAEEEAAPYLQRYIDQLPDAGEIVLFDRSWYNRAMVEPVMGFCTPEQYASFMDAVVAFEQALVGDGKTTLLKLYFSVSRQVQSKRFGRRGLDTWRMSEVDREAQSRWDAYTQMKSAVLRRTHTGCAPWWVIRSDNKKLAHRETLKRITQSIPYGGRSRNLVFTPDPQLCVPGDEEYRRMQAG